MSKKSDWSGLCNTANNQFAAYALCQHLISPSCATRRHCKKEKQTTIRTLASDGQYCFAGFEISAAAPVGRLRSGPRSTCETKSWRSCISLNTYRVNIFCEEIGKGKMPPSNEHSSRHGKEEELFDGWCFESAQVLKGVQSMQA